MEDCTPASTHSHSWAPSRRPRHRVKGTGGCAGQVSLPTVPRNARALIRERQGQNPHRAALFPAPLRGHTCAAPGHALSDEECSADAKWEAGVRAATSCQRGECLGRGESSSVSSFNSMSAGGLCPSVQLNLSMSVCLSRSHTHRHTHTHILKTAPKPLGDFFVVVFVFVFLNRSDAELDRVRTQKTPRGVLRDCIKSTFEH